MTLYFCDRLLTRARDIIKSKRPRRPKIRSVDRVQWELLDDTQDLLLLSLDLMVNEALNSFRDEFDSSRFSRTKHDPMARVPESGYRLRHSISYYCHGGHPSFVEWIDAVCNELIAERPEVDVSLIDELPEARNLDVAQSETRRRRKAAKVPDEGCRD